MEDKSTAVELVPARDGTWATAAATPRRHLVDDGHDKLPGDGHEAARWRT